MMKNKKLKLIIILVLIIQIILPAGILGYHYSVYNYALEHTPDFKFYLSYFDLYSRDDNNGITHNFSESENDVFHFDIAYRYYNTNMEVVSDMNGFAVVSALQDKKLNKHWFSFSNYNKMGAFSQADGEFTYVDTEEAKKIMSEWKQRYYDHYGNAEIEVYQADSLYITAKVYKGVFIPTAVYKDNVKVIEIAAKK